MKAISIYICHISRYTYARKAISIYICHENIAISKYISHENIAISKYISYESIAISRYISHENIVIWRYIICLEDIANSRHICHESQELTLLMYYIILNKLFEDQSKTEALHTNKRDLYDIMGLSPHHKKIKFALSSR